MTSSSLSETIIRILNNKKAAEIKLLKISDLSILGDYFVIAGATSTTHVKALVDEVDFQLSQQGIKPSFIEGYHSNNWIIMDYHDVIVHVFLNETRNYYELERIWADAQEVDITKIIAEQGEQ